jgi:hypothetical protein
MKAEKLIQLLQQDKMLDEQTLVDLQDILKKYPFFQTARILWNYNLLCLKNQHTADNLKITAAYAGDRAKLFKLFHSITAPRYSSDPYEIKHTDASADLGTTTLPTNTVQETTAHEIAAADKKSQLAEEK